MQKKLKTPWARVAWDSNNDRFTIGLIVGVFILMVILGIAWLAFLVWVIVINVQDIQNVGANFWNIFWIVLAGLGILGTLNSNRGS